MGLDGLTLRRLKNWADTWAGVGILGCCANILNLSMDRSFIPLDKEGEANEDGKIDAMDVPHANSMLMVLKWEISRRKSRAYPLLGIFYTELC